MLDAPSKNAQRLKNVAKVSQFGKNLVTLRVERISLTWQYFVGNAQDGSREFFFALEVFVGQISHEEAFVMAEQMEQRVLDVQHVRVLAVQDSGVHQKKLFTGLGFESRLLHDFDGLTCTTGTIFIAEIELGGSLLLR